MGSKKLASLSLSVATLIAVLMAMTGRVSTQVQDLAPPVLVSFDYSPKTIDVSGSSQNVTFTVGISDDLSGVNSGFFVLRSPSGQQFVAGSIGPSNRVSGDTLDGVYEVTLTFPQFSEAGTWRVQFIDVSDNVSNGRRITEAELVSSGFSTELMVIGGPDLATPNLTDFSFSPAAIDVSSNSQNVTFIARITDNLSGFSSGFFGLRSPSGQQFVAGSIAPFNRVSGDALDGVYEVTLIFPQFSEAGTWRVQFIDVSDNVSNGRRITEAELIAAGFPTQLEVASVPDDTVSPTLVSFDYSPKTIDVSGSSQNVTFTVRISDNLSGVNSGFFGLRSPSGQQFVGGSIGPSNRVSGDTLDGVYEVVLTFPQFSEAGTWRVQFMDVSDNVSNGRRITEAELVTLGFPTQLNVTGNQPPVAIVLMANADSFLRAGADDTNEGANERLRIQSSGHNRVVVKFDLSGISTAGLQSATLVLNIAENSDNWGGGGRLVDAHPLLEDWLEGNGRNDVMVPGVPSFRGSGQGVTWRCASDADISDHNSDCASHWDGGTFAAATAAGALHTNGLVGEVSWDVTADVMAGANFGWIIKKQQEGQPGQVRYYSREGAARAGNPNLAPRLILLHAQ